MKSQKNTVSVRPFSPKGNEVQHGEAFVLYWDFQVGWSWSCVYEYNNPFE